MRIPARLAACIALLPALAAAEEGGTGHYLPGSMSSFIDGVPRGETLVSRLNAVDYQGSIGGSVAIPIAGRTAFGADAEIRGYALSTVWRPSWGGFGEGWSYAMGVTVPWLDVQVSADVDVDLPGGGTRRVRIGDSQSGLGDVVIQPIMLNRKVNPDLDINTRLTLYAPTGDYEVGRIANTGKNFWTWSPQIEFLYFGQENGIEASLFVGADLNEENEDTEYESGAQGHLDGTLAQHFPFAGGLLGIGVNGYYYEQLTADRGDGATFGDFEAKSLGAGPVISYVTRAWCSDLLAELKWLHEFDTEKRLEGDIVFLKVAYRFY